MYPRASSWQGPSGLRPRTTCSWWSSCYTSDATGHISSFLSLLQLQYSTLLFSLSLRRPQYSLRDSPALSPTLPPTPRTRFVQCMLTYSSRGRCRPAHRVRAAREPLLEQSARFLLPEDLSFLICLYLKIF